MCSFLCITPQKSINCKNYSNTLSEQCLLKERRTEVFEALHVYETLLKIERSKQFDELLKSKNGNNDNDVCTGARK